MPVVCRRHYRHRRMIYALLIPRCRREFFDNHIRAQHAILSATPAIAKKKKKKKKKKKVVLPTIQFTSNRTTAQTPPICCRLPHGATAAHARRPIPAVQHGVSR